MSAAMVELVPVNILIVEDNPAHAELMRRSLAAGGYDSIRVATSLGAYRQETELCGPAIVLADLNLPDGQALEMLTGPLETQQFPILVLTSHGDEQRAVQALKAGALDYVVKSAEVFANMPRIVERALREWRHIRERQRMEEALRASEERFRRLAESSPDIIFHYVPDRIEYISPMCTVITGFTPEEYYADPELDRRQIHPDDQAKVAAFYQQVEHGPGQIEIRYIHKDGRIIWTERRVVPLFDEAGQLVALEGIVRDVTERKQAEAHLKQLEQQVFQNQKLDSIGRLAGGIAHDMNNMLVPILGYAELGMVQLSPDSRLYAHLGQIRQAANRAADLIKQLLAFSRQQMLQPEVLDLNDIILEFKKMLQRMIGEDIELQTELSPGLDRIKADKVQVEQILMNLAVNARDAMPDGGSLTIQTANVFLDETYGAEHVNVQPGHYVLLIVSDTGHGMNAEIQDRIFEPFFTTKEQGKGTGLGLATVFGIVQQHQGHIEVMSQPDKGTAFKVYLPRTSCAPVVRGMSSLEPAATSRTATILVAEDEEYVRRLICETLGIQGYKVLEAKNPGHCLQIARTYAEPIHLLLTDVVMPKMDGQELYRQVVALHPELKVLYMSGYTDNTVIRRAALQKEVNFLQKPFTVSSLIHKVGDVLG